MAAAKKNGPASTEAPESGAAFDWAAFLPKDYKAEDLKQIGSLTPIYIPEMALEQGWNPVFGDIADIEYLPTQRAGKEDAWTPKMLRVVLRAATKAMSGTKDDRQVVDLEPGQDILVPVTGALEANKELLIRAVDPKHVTTAGFRVKGTKDVGRASPMHDWEVMVHPVLSARTGRFLLTQPPPPAEIVGHTRTGEGFTKDGEVVPAQAAS